MREVLFPPGATRYDWLLDAALTLGLELVTVPLYFFGYSASFAPLAVLSSVLMVAPLVLRRHSPFLALAGIIAAWAMQLVVYDEMMLSLVAMPVVSYTIARWIPGIVARLVIAVGTVGSVIGGVRWLHIDPLNPSAMQLLWFPVVVMVCVGLVVTPYAIGRRVKESFEAHEHMVQTAEERYRSQLVEREQQARITEAAVRTQIARELHDIVAHSLSVMIVQAEGGKAVAAKKPESAIQALDTIAETGREALTEMRRILGVLRSGPSDGDIDYAPTPKLADIPDLVARTSDRARLHVTGEPPNASQALQLTVYRVVQEALTNFLKHAGPSASADVSIQYGSNSIAFDITDDGEGAKAATDHPGHGLKGMQERVTSMGGWLSTHPLPEGGFQVRGVIPLRLSEGKE
ncbi:MAG: sensor histidine kinase [Propionibacteriaceae bacterium]|jgi:signal transduction histidine kinase|nr:sensor histidine kinase [Propionibacteriaceae bacterium]